MHRTALVLSLASPALTPLVLTAQAAAAGVVSQITGLALPPDARADRRGLSKFGAQVVLQMEARKFGGQLKSVEIFYLPAPEPADPSGRALFDALISQLRGLGWAVIARTSPSQRFSLTRDSVYVLGYFEANRKEVQLYFGLSDRAPPPPPVAEPAGQDTAPTAVAAPAANAPAPVPATSTDERTLIGKWSSAAMSIASYLSPSGAFTGDSSIHAVEEYEFRADHSYVSRLLGATDGRVYYTATIGAYRVSGDSLVLTPERRRGGHGGDVRDEADLLGVPKAFVWFIGPDKTDGAESLHLHHDGDYYTFANDPWDYFRRVQ